MKIGMIYILLLILVDFCITNNLRYTKRKIQDNSLDLFTDLTRDQVIFIL